MAKTKQFKTHAAPVWRDRGDFLIQAELIGEGSVVAIEQLWARQLKEERFEICCIPCFAYDLALGDEVETVDWVVQRVVKKSGHYTFRVLLGNSSEPNILERTLELVDSLGLAVECYSH